MKKLISIIAFVLFFVTQIQAQETLILAIDSVGNSQSKVTYLDLDKIGTFDSIALSVYAMGEIDLDSLDVQGGLYVKQAVYKGANVTGINLYEAIEGATLTINNADGTATYVQGIATITKAEAKGYNRLKVTVISASSGNDKADTNQKYILVATVY